MPQLSLVIIYSNAFAVAPIAAITTTITTSTTTTTTGTDLVEVGRGSLGVPASVLCRCCAETKRPTRLIVQTSQLSPCTQTSYDSATKYIYYSCTYYQSINPSINQCRSMKQKFIIVCVPI